MILVIYPPLACSAGATASFVAHSRLDSPTFIFTPYCHLCRVYRQLTRREKVNHRQCSSTLYLCCYLLSVIAYFMFNTEHNRQRASLRLLLMYSVNKPFCSPLSTTIVAVVVKARTPTLASTPPLPPLCVPLVAQLRHWRWFIITLIFFYGLAILFSPARADSAGLALRVSRYPTGSRILGRSQRSTPYYERTLEMDVGFLCLMDDASEVEPKCFIAISENGTLAITEEPTRELKVNLISKARKVEEEEREVAEPQYGILFSDVKRRWFLCLNGSSIASMEICLDEALPQECSWTGVKDAVGIRIRPLVYPGKRIQLGEHTTSLRNVVLRFQRSVNKRISQGDDCSEVREILQPAARKDLSLAKSLLRSLHTAQKRLKLALLKRGEVFKAVHTTVQIINRMVQVRHDMKMAQWNYEGITASDQKRFIGISGCRFKVPETVEEEIDVYSAFREKQRILAWEEQKLVRSLFDRTKRLSLWSDESLLKYKQHPSLSRILQGLKVLPVNMTDMETNLYLVPRYLWEKYASKVSKNPINVQERAILLKLEELVVRRRHKDLLFLSKAECIENLMNQLPGRRRSLDILTSNSCGSEI
ncbi:unnamed protein product [Hydatigera taeniaeformis]|uniref:VPS13 domain-containing protein n=1 Tax=Hydatigena taeniaeformis TaxID=6205 RepID=A0A158REX0_HYDTA|nr:unnamed protein product [Hydatigera taeniaeformis]